MKSLGKLSLFLLCSVAMTMVASQARAQDKRFGVFITVKYKKKCENQVVSLENKKFCIADQPVLKREDLSYITDIKLDLASQHYFNLVFTEAGATKLRNLSIAFPNTQIVLVVDQTIVGFLKDLDILKSNVLKMTAGEQYTNNVEVVHEKLKSVLPVRK
jgi:hypothetical protein